MPPASMSNYTYAFGEMGFVLNTDDISFPFVDVTNITGLDSAPLRTTTTERSGMDGTYVDAAHMSMRTIVITGTLYTDPSDPDTLLNQLRADYNSSTIRPFYFLHPGQPLKFVNGQGGGISYPVDTNRRLGITPVQATVLADDPYIYDYPANTGTIDVPTVITVGTGFNVSFNLGFGGGAPVNAVTVNNSGTHTAYPIITLTGPLTSPTLTDSYGVTMAFNIMLAAGDTLVVDCRNKTVVLNGSVSRRNSLAGLQWFSVPPESAETIFFGAASGNGPVIVDLYNTYY